MKVLFLLAIFLAASVEVRCANATTTRSALQSVCGARGAPLAPIVDQAARRYHIDPLVLVAIIRAESTCDPNAIGQKGEIGLTQIKPITKAARGVPREKLFLPAVNINLGARHLAWALRLCGGLSGALSVYQGNTRCLPTRGSRRVLEIFDEITKGDRS